MLGQFVEIDDDADDVIGRLSILDKRFSPESSRLKIVFLVVRQRVGHFANDAAIKNTSRMTLQ